MSDKKKPYEVTSRIKRDGEYHEEGDTIELTEEEADGLHVKPASGSSGSDEKTKKDGSGDEFDPSKGSHANDYKEAIAYIEDTDKEELEGFVDPDEEDRVTVLRAWDEKFGTDYSGD